MERVYDMNKIGTFIKIKRLEKDYSISTLSKDICSSSTLSKIENNQMITNEEVLNQLLKRLGIVDVSVIIDNSKKVEELTNTFWTQLRLNIVDDIIYKQMEESKTLYDNSFYIISYYLMKLYKYSNIYNTVEITPCDEIIGKLDKIIELGNYTEQYFYTLYRISHSDSVSSNLELLSTWCSKDIYGIMKYTLADYYFHQGQYYEAIRLMEETYQQASKEGNLHLMYESTLTIVNSYLNVLGIHEIVQTYVQRLMNLSNFLSEEKKYHIYYNIGSTLLQQKKYKQAYTYLSLLHGKQMKTDILNFLLHHKLVYLYIELNDENHFEKSMYSLKELNKSFKGDRKKLCNAIIRSLEIKYNDKEYLDNDEYQKLIEYIYQHAQDVFMHGLKKFYSSDMEEVYKKQRKYKELYLMYTNQ